jgi:hypothetical protein
LSIRKWRVKALFYNVTIKCLKTSDFSMLTRIYLTRLCAIALVSASFFATNGAHAAYAKYYRFGIWTASVMPDSFTGKNVCTLKAKGIYYRDGIVGFDFGERTDTQSAEFRINGGAVQYARDFDTEVKSDKLFYETGPLENPDSGRVNLPAKLFANAKFIYVRPSERTDAKRFRLDGLAEATAFIKSKNCL